MEHQRSVQALLIDLDGVLYVDNVPLAGAVNAIAEIKRSGLECRFLTNSSTHSRQDVALKLKGLGFEISADQIFAAPYAARLYLESLAYKKCRYIVSKSVMGEFEWVVNNAEHTTHIVIGDIGEDWNYLLMNDIFNDLLSGAELVAIHKNRFWQTGRGLKLDIGAFVAALEYGSNKPARVFGKPSKEFFDLALADMGVFNENVIMVGDDIDSDIIGAMNVGIKTVLCKTGKFRESYFVKSDICPDYIVDSIASLPSLIEAINES